MRDNVAGIENEAQRRATAERFESELVLHRLACTGERGRGNNGLNNTDPSLHCIIGLEG